MSLTVASYGGGTNSTAMLIECAKRKVPVDLILFADTGGEKPHTYKYVKMFSDWLVEHGLPEIQIVKKVRRNGEILTLEQDCAEKKMLPSIAYGFKTCSQKYKIQPQDKFVNNWMPAKDKWAKGEQITKLIGYDADEPQRAAFVPDEATAKKYVFWYPLIEWDMGRDECLQSIKDAGLPMPGKSACFFCPSSKQSEIRQLAEVYPDLMDRALKMEKNANLITVKGLGRNFAWKDVIATDDMFSDDFRLTPELACGCYDG